MLTENEQERYRRQIMLPGFGEEGQEKLKKARVLVAGAGGLGSPAAFYLAAAGVGFLRIVDSDAVELSNLNRQILHWTRDLGEPKVVSAASKLRALNPEITVEPLQERISEASVLKLAEGCDLVLDALDNLQARYLLNRAALELGIPFVHGAIHGLEGRVMTVLPGKTACLMCIYQGAVVNRKTPVIGTTPGVIASLQATEAIKYLTGMGSLLTGRLLIYDGLNMRFSEVIVNRNPACKHCSGKA